VDIVIEMCKRIRVISPKTKIILGWHGARGIAVSYPENEVKEICDYLCLGEGIGFMRSLLGEPLDAPISITHLPKCGNSLPWLDLHPAGNVGFIVPTIGCPQGCDFCGTTLISDNRHIIYLTPEQTFEEIKRCYREEDVVMGMVLEEDSFINKDYVAEWTTMIKEDTEFGLAKIDLFAAASIAGISNFTYDELAMMGFSGLFFGIESKFAPQEGYLKREGYDAQTAFKELQRRGICPYAGWIAGWDFHDRTNIVEDFNYLVALKPTAVQLTRLCCFPGTPLYERLMEEGRIADHPWEDVTFYGGGGYKHRSFEAHEIDDVIYQGYRNLYETWGPSAIRRLEVELNGYEYCKASEHKALRERAERHYNGSQMVYPLIRACEYFAPNGLVRRRINQIEKRYRELIGEPTSAQQVQANFVLLRAGVEKVRDKAYPRNRHPKEEPFKKYIYKGSANVVPGERPYHIAYPRKDTGFEVYRGIRDLKMSLFDTVSVMADRYDEWRGVKQMVEKKGGALKVAKFL
jgi:haloalkane dehalogenase